MVRVQAAVSLGGALRDIQKTAAKETKVSLADVDRLFCDSLSCNVAFKY